VGDLREEGGGMKLAMRVMMLRIERSQLIALARHHKNISQGIREAVRRYLASMDKAAQSVADSQMVRLYMLTAEERDFVFKCLDERAKRLAKKRVAEAKRQTYIR